MKNIKWGIIGCGNVTEVKSGPAFNKAPNSTLVAVMRRDAGKAADYASRHGVPKWYDDAEKLIQDPEVNAIYIATPPAFHEEYTMAALKAGKSVYVEKPMALNEAACLRMQACAEQTQSKLVVAHYRRAQPLFNQVKELLNNHAIGEVRFVDLKMLQPAKTNLIAASETNWRVNPAISGGGLFHDLAPHQLDLMLYYFGEVRSASGLSLNQAKLNDADDTVSGQIVFENGVLFQGLWCFSVPPDEVTDSCDIVGSEGKISFSVFSNHLSLHLNGQQQVFKFETLEHVQQPMIEQVVQYFRNERTNPCSGKDGADVMHIMDSFTH